MIANYLNNNRLSDFLYNKQTFDFKFPFFRFIVISFDDHQEVSEDIVQIFEGITNIISILIIEERVVIFHYDEIEDLEEILNATKYDLLINFQAFQGCKIEVANVDDFHIIFNLYLKYLTDKDILFSKISDLILTIVKENYSDLNTIRPIILNKISNDPQMENLIYAMFDNNLNVSKASGKTYMHRNTVNYKLDIVKKETGLNIQNFKDAASMYFLLKKSKRN